MITFLGAWSRRATSTKRRPNEPVPPVIRITLPSSTRPLGAKARRAAVAAFDFASPTSTPLDSESPGLILAQAGRGS